MCVCCARTVFWRKLARSISILKPATSCTTSSARINSVMGLEMADTDEPPPQYMHSPLVIIRPYLDPPPVKEERISKHGALVIVKPYLDGGPTLTTVNVASAVASERTQSIGPGHSDTTAASHESGALIIMKPYLDSAGD
ncbi:uncharacterized protein CLAFUR5_09250 [Fulvia fulva]|uniref:Uncharacterized protein n=1 Tax=Passalora fulva TaxID=5499 RepID=A0A9Q8PFV8_PASFU|nr:uncharacterized protein CLAFUR5_09250 [Fulvia fulva]UJO21854.1 hypothetical protein CLAFUR5_09250 [Fulvia fulva]